jgi:hypothetical protein
VAEDSKPVEPSDWVSKTLATLDAINGYTYTALAIAAGLILFLPSPLLGIDLSPIRRDWGAWIVAGVILFALLAVAKCARAVHPMIGNALLARSARRARNMRQADVLKHLDTLSIDERNILAYRLAKNERSMVSSYLNGPLTMLVAKGLFQMTPTPIFTATKMPYTIPDFVWTELQKRKEEFPLPETRNDGTGWMRR